MFDVITFGSITWDIFLELEKFKIFKSKKFISHKGICFNLGSKIDVEDIKFAFGGGGTNTATTFVRQGLKTAYCGTVGNDISGVELVKQVKKMGIDCSLVVETKLKPTNHSIILNTGPNRDRTILTYRGASEVFGKKDVPWKKLNTKWFYLAPLSGKLANITKDIVDFAKINGIKVAFNPSQSQLNLKDIRKIIDKVDVLLLNQEEASILTNTSFKKELKIFKAIDKMCPGIVIMTKGVKGVVVSDGISLYEANPGKIKVVDRTGAGDSFGSGFVSELAREKSIEHAIQLGIANANSCLGKLGAKNGLLKKGDKFKYVKIKKKKL